MNDILTATAPPVAPAFTGICKEAVNENIAKGLPVNTQDYAIIIGLNHYLNLKPLNGPIPDACKLRDWLVSADGGNLLPNHCLLIPSVDNCVTPDQTHIDLALSKLFNLAKNGQPRRLYFYFSGHGFGANWEANGMCLPIWSEELYNAALSSEAYLDLLVESDIFEEIYFFMDCCRDRRINSKPLPPMLGTPGQPGGKSMALVLYASEYENPAWEGLAIGNGTMSAHGYFSRALLEALNGAAVNSHGDITIESFISCVKEKTENYAQQKNQNQSVRYDIRNNNKSLQYVLYKTNRIPGTDVSIRFNTAAHIKLDGPLLTAIREDDVKAGDTWQLRLEKGFYQISEMASKRHEFITIDGTTKTVTYDF
ncbi:Caspase domain-containing protein [Chitinophaga sp. CF118]|uniref:caspase family protein n=1 Tax=Chitinophaga sp. CF118 TaxID=1884367 RepID=UPI0008E0E052|nr:caspase family protein [Chitinophaga sp. CF118]SFF02713.1 Caspase domain-containing protein [Chitinophaga sp. CF118]